VIEPHRPRLPAPSRIATTAAAVAVAWALAAAPVVLRAAEPAPTDGAAAAPSPQGDETSIPVVLVGPGGKLPPAAAGPRPARPLPPTGGLGFWQAVVAVTLLSALALVGRRTFSRRRRRCPECGQRMNRLSAEKTFDFLEPAERVQSATGEVKFQLWGCPACGCEDLDADIQPMPLTAGVRPSISPLGLSDPAPRQRRGPSLLRLPKDDGGDGGNGGAPAAPAE
jgi:hypothetical protein